MGTLCVRLVGVSDDKVEMNKTAGTRIWRSSLNLVQGPEAKASDQSWGGFISVLVKLP